MPNIVPDAPHPAGWYRSRIEYLSQFATPERAATMMRVLSERTRWITVCTENTFHAQNASAIVRTCEAFGIQDLHTVEDLCPFSPHTDIVRGTDKWIGLHRHRCTEDAVRALRAAGYRIAATSPHEGDVSPEEFDIASGPFALVFGTEHAGISRRIMDEADGFIRIPMCGFVESLNVSASAAIALYILTRRLRESRLPWRLTEEERLPLLYDWLRESVRDSDGILARFGNE